ncbi:DNA/RNA polymerases superfamily protein [Gossypium australe]|uniref:DNA/RNA polymerases superfamily protein n=1 Tax=Gossypium australe TaxID=47621 RepID=A0A5B6X1C0_9ROSI|nr:DNA/RNA polymerases superfamily protein [Gossypium australe]
MFRDRICIPKNSEIFYARHIVVAYLFTRGMKRDISKFVSKCLICQQVKAEHQVPSGLLQPMMTSEVTTDFVSGLPLSPKKKDAIWVVVDRLTKSAHFILVRLDYLLERLTKLYIAEIVRLHVVPNSIILDRDLRFTSRFWKKLQEAMDTKLNFSIAFHPQTDRQSERVFQILEDMLRYCVLMFESNWEKYLRLVEFVYKIAFSRA